MGIGFDAHQFTEGTFITLCGIKIPYTQTLAGHSDADCAWHALTDAILGALALGDLGDYFPSSDKKWHNEPSSTFLEYANQMVFKYGYKINNCDLTIISQQPKIKPFRMIMQRETAKVLNIDAGQVSIKATTTDGLGFTGRVEGIATQAVVLLSPLSES